MAIALGFGGTQLLSACRGDECSAGEATCDGNVAKNCEPLNSDQGAPYQFSDENCGSQHCVLAKRGGQNRAICALEASRSTRCEQEPRGWCSDKQPVACVDGYPITNGDACDATRVCVLGPVGSVCASSEIDLRCGDLAESEFCQNNLLTHCRDGHIVSQGSCESAQTCVQDGSHASCELITSGQAGGPG